MRAHSVQCDFIQYNVSLFSPLFIVWSLHRLFEFSIWFYAQAVNRYAIELYYIAVANILMECIFSDLCNNQNKNSAITNSAVVSMAPVETSTELQTMIDNMDGKNTSVDEQVTQKSSVGGAGKGEYYTLDKNEYLMHVLFDRT